MCWLDAGEKLHVRRCEFIILIEPQQKYRLGTIRNIKLLAGLNRFYRRLTSPSSSGVVHNIQLVVRFETTVGSIDSDNLL